jgi:hypothetical protein
LKNSVYRLLPDSNSYRTLGNPSVHPKVLIELDELFRDGKQIGDAWHPPFAYLTEDEGEITKPIGSFPAGPGLFVIDQDALRILLPIIESTIIEILPLPAAITGLSVLNIMKVDCIDHNKSRFKYFPSGRIMRIERFEFVGYKLEGRHIFRLEEESFAKIFADDFFKNAVEENGLQGLLFLPLDQA